jgi:diguanylate cyclase (GGDEF)-like protein
VSRPEASPLSSNRPDLHLLDAFAVLHRVLVSLVATVSAISLCGWLIPPLSRVLPHFQLLGMMKVNNALTIFLCSASLILSEPRRPKIAVQLSRLLAGVAMLLTAVLVFERLSGITYRIDTLLAADAASPHPGRVAIEACGTLFLMGFVLFNIRARKRPLARLVDGITLCILFLMLTFASRYAYGLRHVFGSAPSNPMSLQTFSSLCILTWLIVTRRTEYGAFSILLDSEIGGKTARLAAPCAIFLPYIFALFRSLAIKSNLVSETSANAAATSILAVLGFCLVLALARKTKDIDNIVRELSLRDELTELYNRRGFYVLAEQALRFSQRAGESFFVLFIDLDDLKKTNDTLGHEAGSELIRTTAAVLKETFRETDVIGRIGGDEFVVAGRLDADNIANPVRRLEEATLRENSNPARRFPFNYSLGYAFSDGTSSENLEKLLQMADMMMYEAKRTKKHLRPEAEDQEFENYAAGVAATARTRA